MIGILAHHGTCRDFDRFDGERLGSFNPGATCRLGFFLSADPRIAAHFTLRTDVLEQGYDQKLAAAQAPGLSHGASGDPVDLSGSTGKADVQN